jgi:hypothetical protein
MSSQLWLAVLSSSVISGTIGALIAGWFNLRSKHTEYANMYYKMVLEKRIKAYEAVEYLINQIKIAVVDTDNRPCHLLFSKDNDHANVYKTLAYGMPDALWLSDDLFEATRDLNILVYTRAPDGFGLTEFGKAHYREIAELRTRIERLHTRDMTSLHEVPKFLRNKKPGDAYTPVARGSIYTSGNDR